jgi:transcriptional regulator with XRE-family HTH domain
MGRLPRPRPARLGEKLLQIREALGLSQNGILRILGFADVIDRSAISDYENDVREPPLPVLLEYAQAANVFVDVLINDELDLPGRLPCSKKSEGIGRRSSKKAK